MRRDMDLVREILMQLADAEGPLDSSAFTGEGRSRDLVGYHIQIMAEGGLISATVVASSSSPYALAQADRLTWAGNEFLDSVRSPAVWSRVKMAAAKAAGGASAADLQSLAAQAVQSLASQALALP